MRNFRHFLNKLTYALIAVIALSGCFEPLGNNILSSMPNQVVYAKKAKKRAKKSRKETVSAEWKWAQPKASVYVDLDGDKNLTAAANHAIQVWNDTGAFTFTKTKNKKKADITIESVYSPNTTYAGYTTFHFYVKSGLLFSADTKLNTYYLDNFSSYNYSMNELSTQLNTSWDTQLDLSTITDNQLCIQPALSILFKKQILKLSKNFTINKYIKKI